MRQTFVLPGILALWTSLPSAAHAEGKLFPGQEPPKNTFTAPDRGFSLQTPTNWVERTFPDQPDFVEFRIDGPGDAWLQVRRLKVPSGARPRQILARAVEFRLKKLPHYTEIGRRDLVMAGANGSSVFGTFWYQGNAEFPRAFEELYFVNGTEAFEFHFECFEPMAGQISAVLDKVYRSFVPHPVESAPGNMQEDDEDYLDKIPF